MPHKRKLRPRARKFSQRIPSKRTKITGEALETLKKRLPKRFKKKISTSDGTLFSRGTPTLARKGASIARSRISALRRKSGAAVTKKELKIKKKSVIGKIGSVLGRVIGGVTLSAAGAKAAQAMIKRIQAQRGLPTDLKAKMIREAIQKIKFK